MQKKLFITIIIFIIIINFIFNCTKLSTDEEKLSSDAYLSGLTISSGTLSPAFSSSAASYITWASNGTTSVTVTPTAQNTKAIIKMNGITVVSGQQSESISLSVGSNDITIVVTAQSGSSKTYTINAERKIPPLETITVPAITNFVMGYTDIAVLVHTVTSISSYQIGKYEITYEQWYKVRIWAINNGYTFSNLGNGGEDLTDETKLKPVRFINWRDAIVWCNAASEYNGLTPVYYTDLSLSVPLRISTNTESIDTTQGSEDNPYVYWSQTGYRLPTEAEWEAAAGYQNGTVWTPGNFAWYSVNSSNTTHPVGAKNQNQLGLYDMTGNVSEYCWDWYAGYTNTSPFTDPNPKGYATGSQRSSRGGHFNSAADWCQITRRIFTSPYEEFSLLGFRVVRSIP